MENEQNKAVDSPTSSSGFEQLFSRYYKRRRLAELFYLLARLFIALVVTLLIYAAIDYYYPLSNEERMLTGAILLGVTALLSLVLFIKTRYLSVRKSAAELDVPLKGQGKILGAWELEHPEHPSSSPHSLLSEWLKNRTKKEAENQISSSRLPLHPHFKKWLHTGLIALSLIVALVLTSFFSPHAFTTLGGRLFTPWRDIAPFSPYTFTLVDFPEEVIYGDDALLQVDISGGELKSPVILFVRSPGLPVQSLNAFRENTGMWARLLEKLTSPCEVAFGTEDGRARSNWNKINISYQPKVLSGFIKSTPPEYTKMPEIRIPISGQEVAVIDGGVVEYHLKCNRIPSRANAIFQSDRKELPPMKIEGTILPDQTVTFRIPVRHSGQVSINIEDYKGTQMARPFESKIRVLPDYKPTLTIHRPTPVSLSLPDQIINFQAEAEDDFGLSRVSWLRRAGDTRMRETVIPLKGDSKSQLINEIVFLNNIGVKPGDVLEFSIEAKDENPHFLNIATAEAVKVIIISDEEARKILREQALLEEFTTRFQLVSQLISEVVEAIDEAMKNTNQEDRKALLSQLEEKHKTASQAIEQLASDFPIFDQEKELSDLSSQIAKTLTSNIDDLKKIPDSNPLSDALQPLRDRLVAPQQEANNMRELAMDLEKITKGYEIFLNFKQMTDEQKEIHSQYLKYEEELQKLRKVTREHLDALTKEQEQLRNKLLAWEKEVPTIIESLPNESASELKSLIESFMQAYKEALIPGMMSVVSTRSKDGQYYSARTQAEKVHTAMMELLTNNLAASSCLGGQCSGLGNLSPCAQETARQLLNSLLATKKGSGGYGSGGGGYGGVSISSGLPINGVKRNRVSIASGGRSQGNEGLGNKSQSGNSPRGNVITEQSPGEASGSNSQDSNESLDGPVINSIPPSYRDAVRKYLNQL